MFNWSTGKKLLNIKNAIESNYWQCCKIKKSYKNMMVVMCVTSVVFPNTISFSNGGFLMSFNLFYNSGISACRQTQYFNRVEGDWSFTLISCPYPSSCCWCPHFQHQRIYTLLCMYQMFGFFWCMDKYFFLNLESTLLCRVLLSVQHTVWKHMYLHLLSHFM